MLVNYFSSKVSFVYSTMPGPRQGRPWTMGGSSPQHPESQPVKVKLIRCVPPMVGEVSSGLIFFSYENTYSMGFSCTKNMLKDPDLFQSLYEANIQEFLNPQK